MTHLFVLLAVAVVLGCTVAGVAAALISGAKPWPEPPEQSAR